MTETTCRLVVSLPSDPGLREAFDDVPADQLGEVEFVEWDLDGPAPRDRFDIVVPQYWGRPRQLLRLDGLDVGLVQGQSIGFDGVEDHLPSGVPFANAATVHETSTAELAVGLAIACQRGFPKFVRDTQEHRWDRHTLPSFADRRILLVGYGGVSRAIEARLAGFEVSITRIARSARTERNPAGDEVPVHGFDELQDLLADAEIVILGVPLTAETTGLIDAAALAAMPDGALLINVARGPVVDTDALVAELRTGRIRAALDVTDPEPLPEGHPLWDLPNVLITPHVGGDTSAMHPRLVALILRQLAHLRAGERPENLVFGG